MVEIEEISDSDPEEMDIDEYDDAAPLRPAVPRAAPPASIINPADIPVQARPGGPSPQSTPEENKQKSKKWQCLYPVYFDKSRTRAEGRRVGKEVAVENPLAREIAEAVAKLGMNVVFEPTKTHPKDWANPGRCRVLIKEEGRAVHKDVSNKHHLYLQLAKYMRANPTTKETPYKLKLPGMPPMQEPMPDPAVPRGWKVGKILPLHSAAVTGGGVNENFFKDMMAEMQGMQGGAGGPSAAVPPPAAPPAVKAKKDKKKLKG